MLHIFHLKAKIPVGYDSIDSLVVIAKDESEARHMVAESPGDEGQDVWLLDDLSSCVAIGTPHLDAERRIVVCSFNAG